jgi:hypothetical protein
VLLDPGVYDADDGGFLEGSLRLRIASAYVSDILTSGEEEEEMISH